MNDTKKETCQTITLTEEQQKIYDKLIDFIKSDKELEILLSSSAGTGKTTLMTYLVNNVIKSKLCRRIVICSPTHKSLNILKSKMFETSNNSLISSNVDIMTIHRLLNYQKVIDTNGEVNYSKVGTATNWSIYDLVIVDECSMLSNQIIDDIEHEIKKDKNKKLKIVFTGDQSQLNPVNQTISKIFYKKIKTLTLEKIIRTNSENIMNLSNEHRKWISSNDDKDMPYLSDFVSENITLHSQKSVENWLDKFIKYLKDFDNTKIETYNLNNNIILTWTNKKCNKYNDYVRQKMFNKKNLDKYEIGEILIFNDFHRILIKYPIDENNTDKEEPKYENKIISFYTSEQVKLHSVKQDKFTFERIKNLKSTDIPEDISTKFVKTITEINKVLLNTTLDVYFMEVQKISEVKDKNAQIYDIMAIHNKSEIEYNKLKEYFEEQMIKLKNSCYKMVEELKIPKNSDSSSFNMIKAEYVNIIDKKINRIWKDWQGNVIDRFAQLNYGYSITVHKSQGSTFKNVFIDIMDIFENHNQSERLKCLYTAITRSSHSLELLV
jgi:hypothetical protein